MRWTPHVTVATVIEHDGRFLLVHEQIAGSTQFNQPAGHLEPDEDLVSAAVRETLEETRWQVDITGVIGISVYKSPHNGETYVRHTFIGRTLNYDASRELDSGIIEALWLTRSEVAARAHSLRSPMVLQVIDDYLAGRYFPLEVMDSHR